MEGSTDIKQWIYKRSILAYQGLELSDEDWVQLPSWVRIRMIEISNDLLEFASELNKSEEQF